MTPEEVHSVSSEVMMSNPTGRWLALFRNARVGAAAGGQDAVQSVADLAQIGGKFARGSQDRAHHQQGGEKSKNEE